MDVEFIVHKTFLEVRSKTALQRCQQLKQTEIVLKQQQKEGLIQLIQLIQVP